jgi:hypothetical protein
MTFGAKNKLKPQQGLDDDLDKLSEFILQVYKQYTCLLVKFPYLIRSCSDFKREIQLINQYGIKAIYKNVKNIDYPDFQFKVAFSGEFRSTFIDPLKEN